MSPCPFRSVKCEVCGSWFASKCNASGRVCGTAEGSLKPEAIKANKKNHSKVICEMIRVIWWSEAWNHWWKNHLVTCWWQKSPLKCNTNVVSYHFIHDVAGELQKKMLNKAKWEMYRACRHVAVLRQKIRELCSSILWSRKDDFGWHTLAVNFGCLPCWWRCDSWPDISFRGFSGIRHGTKLCASCTHDIGSRCFRRVGGGAPLVRDQRWLCWPSKEIHKAPMVGFHCMGFGQRCHCAQDRCDVSDVWKHPLLLPRRSRFEVALDDEVQSLHPVLADWDGVFDCT